MKQWDDAKSAYDQGRSIWIPVDEDFYLEMLEVLPPICFAFHPFLGTHFAVSEAWKHDDIGQPIYLFFRSKPTRGCRMASVAEFDNERRKLLPPDWQVVTDEEKASAFSQLTEPWSKMSGALHMAMRDTYKNNAVCIDGIWFKAPNV